LGLVLGAGAGSLPSEPTTADPSGTIYIADPERHLIQRYNADSKAFETVIQNAGAPASLAAGVDGSLYFNDQTVAAFFAFSREHGSRSLVQGSVAIPMTVDLPRKQNTIRPRHRRRYFRTASSSQTMRLA